MADVYEQNLGSKSSLTTSDYIRVVGTDNVSYKETISNVKTLLNTVSTTTNSVSLYDGTGTTVIATGTVTVKTVGKVHVADLSMPLNSITISSYPVIKGTHGIAMTFGVGVLRIGGGSFSPVALQLSSSSTIYVRGGFNGSSLNPTFTTDANGGLYAHFTWIS